MQSVGKLVYSPRSHLGSNDKWLVMMCDDEISKYYRSLYAMDYPYLNGDRCGKLTRPVWGTHISIIRGEFIPNFHLWGLDTNKIISFDYEGGVIDNREYYWLRVFCPALKDLRMQYGLSPEPRFGFHLTIGRTTQDVGAK
jgi:hypothetical protein